MSYIQAIGIGFSAVQCHAIGDGSVYEDIIWDAGEPIPSQEALDSWIVSNPQAEVPVNTKITVLALRNRFTQTEKITIEMASLDNPAASAPQRQLAASLRVMLTDLSVATFVDLTREDTIVGIHALETYGIIGVGRADQILSLDIQDSEVPLNL